MKQTIDDLIIKSLAEEISEDDRMLLNEWISKSEGNKRVYESMKSFWLQERDLQLKDQIWDEIDKETSNFTERTKKNSLSRHLFFKIAASLLFLILSYVIFQATQLSNTEIKQVTLIEKICPKGARLTVQLPDGSRVTLNSSSSIQYPQNFNNQNFRQVNLEGKAFFQVESNPESPFIVMSGGIKTKVLGTSFCVDASKKDESRISVKSGKVSVYFEEIDREIYLNPSEMAVYDQDASKYEKSPFNEIEEFGWINGIIYFNHADFDEIIEVLQNHYGVNINVEGTINEEFHYSGSYQNQSLEKILSGISFVEPFEFTISDNDVNIQFEKGYDNEFK